MEMYATCSFGLEALVKEELQDLGMEEIRAEDARVFFCGDEQKAVRANLCLRCADRVFIKLAAFPATSFDMLYEGMRALHWPDILPRDASIIVTGKTAHSKLVSVRDMQSIGKKAIVDAMAAGYGYTRCPETGINYNIEIGMLRDEATIGLNTSGPGLNRRGYRDLSAQAPLRETLAAGLVKLARYRGGEVLYDPCCGSGTIAIEAAMIAANIAPGLQREFALDSWPEYASASKTERERAQDMRREHGFAHVEAMDIDGRMASMTHRHARQAGVSGFININKADVRDFQPQVSKGVIVTNPPYGQRLERQAGIDVANALGALKRDMPGLGVFVISSDEDFGKHFGRKPDKRRKLYNGNQRCYLNMYFRRDMGKPAKN